MQVCDFGLSRVLAAGHTHVSTQPQGTATHLAPEVWAEGHMSLHADVYAFGITRECERYRFLTRGKWHAGRSVRTRAHMRCGRASARAVPYKCCTLSSTLTALRPEQCRAACLA